METKLKLWTGWDLVRRFVRLFIGPQQLTERLYDEEGRLLWEKPYLFRCLFSEGQGMIAESVPMTILSCRLDGHIVTTRVKLHKPWPNVKMTDTSRGRVSKPNQIYEVKNHLNYAPGWCSGGSHCSAVYMASLGLLNKSASHSDCHILAASR